MEEKKRTDVQYFGRKDNIFGKELFVEIELIYTYIYIYD